MADPTIPRHQTGGAPPLTYGWFVTGTAGTFLCDWQGNRWPVNRVAIVQGSWGYSHEGVEKLPRPMLKGQDGSILFEGDRVLIDFFMGDPNRPVVRGGLRSLSSTDFLAYSNDVNGANPNRLRIRVAPINSSGEETGDVRLLVADDNAGTVELLASNSVAIRVGSNLDAPDVEIVIKDGQVLLGSEGATDPVTLASLVVARLNAIETAFNLHTHVYSPGPLPPASTAPAGTAGTSTVSSVAATKVKAT